MARTPNTAEDFWATETRPQQLRGLAQHRGTFLGRWTLGCCQIIARLPREKTDRPPCQRVPREHGSQGATRKATSPQSGTAERRVDRGTERNTWVWQEATGRDC